MTAVGVIQLDGGMDVWTPLVPKQLVVGGWEGPEELQAGLGLAVLTSERKGSAL